LSRVRKKVNRRESGKLLFLVWTTLNLTSSLMSYSPPVITLKGSCPPNSKVRIHQEDYDKGGRYYGLHTVNLSFVLSCRCSCSCHGPKIDMEAKTDGKSHYASGASVSWGPHRRFTTPGLSLRTRQVASQQHYATCSWRPWAWSLPLSCWVRRSLRC
jgi:hypothetical protein